MKQWRFVSNQNSTIVGINNAGIETFSANMNKSLIREIIQNSLDAVLPESKEPVLIDFNLFNTPRILIPDVDNLHGIIKKCRESNKDEPDAFKFFNNADNIMKEDFIKVLRISDHNTVGLEGSETCEKGTNWSRLVKENGSSNKGQNSGGSFGIGKSAAFACSDLRTVFYSSIDKNKIPSNFGVANLVSYKDDELGWTTGVGYYSEDDKFCAIPELARIDNNFQRTDSGTDIYVIGMHELENFKEIFIEAVLLDFLVSLTKGKLIVRVQDEVIDKKTLTKYISQLNPYKNEEIKNLIEYFNLLTSSDPTILKIPLDASKYGKKYGFMNGDCTLYLKEGEGYNRKVLVTRNAGMRILEFNRISGSIEFTGILVIEGNKMNETFKAMEVPSHDAFEPGRCRGEEKFHEEVLVGIKRYVKEIVKENFGKIDANSIDAIGASDFLPDKMEENEQSKLQKNDLSTRIKNLFGKDIAPTKKKTRTVDISEVDSAGDGDNGSGPGAGPGPEPGEGPHPGPNPGPYPGLETKKGEKEKYKEISVKKRLICKDSTIGKYILHFIAPTHAKKGKLEFSLAGEQSDFELPIKSAQIISDNKTAIVESAIGNKVYLRNLVKGEPLKVEVEVDFDSYCMMEVEYYAN